MPAEKIAANHQISLHAIKALSAAHGPCVSILLPVEAPQNERVDRVRLKQALEKIEPMLLEKGMEKGEARKLMESLKATTDATAFTGKALALYGAPEVCEVFHIPITTAEHVAIGDHFNIKPLISLLTADQPFYVLALSQKHIRLLRCTAHTSEEVELPASIPTSLRDDSQSEKPDHVQDNRSSGGPSVGAMKGVSFTTNTDSEKHEEYLQHFFKHVSDGVSSLLKDELPPLVIAGVDYETAAFRRVSAYPRLVEETVHGAPDSLKGGELHKRALEAMGSYAALPLKTALSRYSQMEGGERASSTVKEIVKAAFEGRVLDLILAEGAEYLGSFHEAKQTVKAHGEEDLLNVAALQTILHAGNVFVVPSSQVPHGARTVAVFRY
jgi:hypothetical protein